MVNDINADINTDININFSEVNPDDEVSIESLANFASRIWHEYFPILLSAEQIDYMVDKFQSVQAIKEQLENGYRYFIVYQEKNMLAYFGVQPQYNNNAMFLSKLYVKNDTRSTGIGSKCLDFIIDLTQELNLNTIELTCNKYNEASLAFYRKKGFIEIDSIITDIGRDFVMDDYVMSLSLT